MELGGRSQMRVAATLWGSTTLVDALVWALLHWDTRWVFGVSGANIEHLHDAIARLGGNRLRAVLAKSEVGAAFMADGRARTHRTLGVCCATSGGGMMNLAVGLAESYASGVPVLAIIGQVPQTLEGCGGFQDSSGIGQTVDALALCRATSRYANKVTEAAEFWSTLSAAVRAAMAGGPACLLIPRDMYERDVPPPPDDFPTSLAALQSARACSVAQVDALDTALRRAGRPVFIAGRGVGVGFGQAQLEELSQRSGIPVAASMANPAAINHDHPLYLGCVGAAGHPSAHRYINEHADLIVTLGCALGIMERQPLATGLARATVIRVSEATDAEDTAARALLGSQHLDACPTEVIEKLLARHKLRPYKHPVLAYELQRYVSELLPLTGPASTFPATLRQSEAISELERWLPPGGHVVFDAGNCAAAAIHGLRLPRHSTSTIALGMGGMGYGIAAAIGMQLDAPEAMRTTVFCGDGAVLMQGFEIHTAVEWQLPILFIVFNNAGHGMCVTRQRLYFDGRTPASTYAPINCTLLARALAPAERLWTARVSTIFELQRALYAFQRQNTGPGLLELVIECEEMPPFAPFLPASAPTYGVGNTPDRSGRAA